ncbi:MAG: SDR family NAD(P)-dependent oxidoreductase [Tannerella sp.]|jgi:short-subunit dehydrogenase|nr:SDR family NAD(P)-dependent oxidoreductase [Tannerella sp.]
MKKAIIVGATSGIGREVAGILLNEGWQLGVAGRREEELKSLKALAPERVSIEVLDVTAADASQGLLRLIRQTDGMDVFLLASGIGAQNMELQSDIEEQTVHTNVEGFVRMVTTAFRFFRERNGGHIAVISSVAGTKGMSVAPSYSASKRFQSTYIEALAQLAHTLKLPIRFTDIRPGFVMTPLLDRNKHYPMLMEVGRVARLIVKALKKQKRIAVIDRRYALLVFFWRLIPGWAWERMRLAKK